MRDEEKKIKYEDCSNCPSLSKGLFCELKEESLKELNRYKITNIFKKGQTLFVEGAPPFGLYCISTGNVKVSKSSSNGRDAIVRIVTSGDILGHRSIFSDESYAATATAIEDTSVCFLDKKFIMELIQKSPSVACKLMHRLGKDLGASENKVASFSQKNVFERTCELLLLLSQSHGIKEDDKIKLNIILTREEIASMVGTAPETLIRVISDLKKDKVIAQSGKNIYLLNIERLTIQANIQD